MPSSTTTCNAVNVPSSHRTTGVSNTDVVVYVTTESSSSASYVAWAIACFIDDHNRPVAGQINFNLYNMGSSYSDDLIVALHELTHLLGFSSSFYSLYRDPATQKVYAQPTITATERGKSVMKLATPKLLATARYHYGCPSLNGLELEDIGGSGTAGSHWEARVAFGDYMVGVIYSDSVVSHLTLSLFEDMGWYQVNHSMASDAFVFAQNAGCATVMSKCISGGEPVNAAAFCKPPAVIEYGSFEPENMAMTCKADRSSVLWCAATQYPASDAPESYSRYFDDPYEGGWGYGVYADYCPIYQWVESVWSNCSLGTASQRSQWVNLFGERGYTFGSSSRCFDTSLSVSSSAATISSCYGLRCASDAGHITFTTNSGSSFELACPTSGGSLAVPGYSGALVCPSFSELCPSVVLADCTNKCSGRGSCVASDDSVACSCYGSYASPDCSELGDGSDDTPTPTPTPTSNGDDGSRTPSPTPQGSGASLTATPTRTPSRTPSRTPTSSRTPSNSRTPSRTPSPSPTPTPSSPPGSVSLTMLLNMDTGSFNSTVQASFISSLSDALAVDASFLSIIDIYTGLSIAPPLHRAPVAAMDTSSSFTNVVVAVDDSASLPPESLIALSKSAAFVVSGFDVAQLTPQFVPIAAVPSAAHGRPSLSLFAAIAALVPVLVFL